MCSTLPLLSEQYNTSCHMRNLPSLTILKSQPLVVADVLGNVLKLGCQLVNANIKLHGITHTETCTHTHTEACTHTLTHPTKVSKGPLFMLSGTLDIWCWPLIFMPISVQWVMW